MDDNLAVLKDWRQIEPGVWSATTTEGHAFVIEDITGATGPAQFQASQVLRTCRSSREHPVGVFASREEAMEFLDRLAAGLQARNPNGCDACG